MMAEVTSRRSVLQSMMAIGAVCAADGSLGQIAAANSEPRWILIGLNQGQGIFRARWDSASGEIGEPELAVATSKPSYLTHHPRLPVVYSCNEDHAPDAAVSAFALKEPAASLTPLAHEPTRGSAPCFVSVDRTAQLLFAANYSGGSLAVFPLDKQGKPGTATVVFECKNKTACGAPGPVKDRQEGPHLHCAVVAPDNRSVLACDLGDDSILVFPIHPGGVQPLGPVIRIPTTAGAGPRHLAFHPNGKWLYCINELNCTVVLYRWRGGAIPAMHAVEGATASILPKGDSSGTSSTGAELVISHDGRFAYASTRFSDVLTVFRVDANSGRLQQLQQLPCGGKTPRFFALDPSERWLLCANQDSSTISVFARDAQAGTLKPTETYPAPNPQCLLWV